MPAGAAEMKANGNLVRSKKEEQAAIEFLVFRVFNLVFSLVF